MASFDENGKYIKTDWKAGDKITATKLNKIEESIEAVNDNDISRHVEADARLDALEAKDVAHDKELTNIKNTIANNKAAAELGDYEINSRMTFLEEELNDGIEEVRNVASTVDGKIATAEANMTAQVNQGKADMEAMVDEVENNVGYSLLQKVFVMPEPNGVDDTEVFNSIPSEYTTVIFQEGTYILDRVKLHSYTIYEGLKRRSFIKAKNDIAFTWEGTLEFVEIRNLSFNGSGCAIGYTNPYDYFSTVNIHHCDFYASLNECIKANLILCDISHNTFGYLGTVNGSHSHIKSIGDPMGNQTNINIISNNRFYSATDYCIYFEYGYQIKLTDNNFERLNCTPIRLYGLYLNDIRGNWFELNDSPCQIYYNNDNQGLVGNYISEVTQNFFAMIHDSNVRIVEITGSCHLTFTHNGGSQCKDKYVYNYEDDGYLTNMTYYGNHLTQYNGAMINRLPLPKPTYSLKGVNNDVWFKNFTTSSTDIKQKGLLSWSSEDNAEYIGKVIKCELKDSWNLVYMSLPVKYFRGKTIRIQGLAMSPTTNDKLKLGCNFTEAEPSSLVSKGEYFATDDYSEQYFDITVPNDATALHFGFVIGGDCANQFVYLKALDLFVIENGDNFKTSLI